MGGGKLTGEEEFANSENLFIFRVACNSAATCDCMALFVFKERSSFLIIADECAYIKTMHLVEKRFRARLCCSTSFGPLTLTAHTTKPPYIYHTVHVLLIYKFNVKDLDVAALRDEDEETASVPMVSTVLRISQSGI